MAVLISVIRATGYYVVKDKIPSLDGVFTTYNPLHYHSTDLGTSYTTMITNTDSTLVKKVTTESDSEFEVNDNIHREESPADSTSFTETDIENADKKLRPNNIFKLNTSFDKIADFPNSKNEYSKENKASEDYDSFSELHLSKPPTRPPSITYLAPSKYLTSRSSS
ncbi:MAG: hypothetical protein ACJA1A_003043 [Saprospiraceae bacterium]